MPSFAGSTARLSKTAFFARILRSRRSQAKAQRALRLPPQTVLLIVQRARQRALPHRKFAAGRAAIVAEMHPLAKVRSQRSSRRLFSHCVLLRPSSSPSDLFHPNSSFSGRSRHSTSFPVLYFAAIASQCLWQATVFLSLQSQKTTSRRTVPPSRGAAAACSRLIQPGLTAGPVSWHRAEPAILHTSKCWPSAPLCARLITSLQGKP